METHNRNLNHLFDIDSVVYPAINYRHTNLTDVDGKIWFFYDISSKVSVKGRNGERYFVPVVSRDRSDVDNQKLFLDRFHDKCKSVRDHFITKEGKDVLISDYTKIKIYKTKHIGDDKI